MKSKKYVLVWVLTMLFSVTACTTHSDVSSGVSFSSSFSSSFYSSSESSSSEDSSSVIIPEPDPEPRYVEAVQDPYFEQGFGVIGNDRASDGTKPKKYVKTSDGDIIWNVAQWNSKYDFNDGVPTCNSAITLLKDKTKALRVNRILHTATLAIDTTQEYETMATSRKNWAHLLLSQGFPSFEEYRLSDFQSLDVTLDFSVTKAVKGTIETRDPDGAFPAPNTLPAQFLQYLYVVNKNPQSPGYNSFMWFGVGYMDTRKAVKPVGYLQDFAGGQAGNFIYGMSSVDTLGEGPFELGKLYQVRIDVLPHIEIALQTAQQCGFMLNTTLQDCTLTGMNIGWELPGAWDVSATISNLSVKGVFKEV